MDDPHASALLRTARSLRSSLLVVFDRVDELCDLLERRGPIPLRESASGPARPALDVNRGMLSVLWKGRTCYLGYTLPFRLIERLAQRPGHYLRVDRLADDLWDGPRAASTVRSAVSDLRAKLVAAGMRDLASMIDGSNPGHYGLRAVARRDRSDSGPTASRHPPDRA